MNTQETQSLYQRLRAAGAVLDRHESDLYVRADPASVAIVRAWVAEDRERRCYSYFRSALDGRQWLDVPFQFDPFWTAKEGKK